MFSFFLSSFLNILDKILFKKFYFQAEKSKRLQERVDSIAMYLFPCIFLAFNLIYWPYYLFYNVVDEDRPNQMTRQFTL